MTGNSYVTGKQITLGTIEVDGRFNRTTRFGVRDLGNSRHVMVCTMSQDKVQSPVDPVLCGHGSCNLCNKTGLLESFPSIETKGVFNVSMIV